MKISMAMIADRLEHHSPIVHISKDDGLKLKSIRILNGRQTVFEPDYVYIARPEDLPESLFTDSQASIICIGRCIPADNSQPPPSCSLIVLDEKCGLLDVFSETQSIFDFYNDWDSKLQNCLNNESGFQSILDVSYEVIKQPMFISDASLKALAYTREVSVEEVNEPEWTSIVKNGFSSMEVIKILKKNNIHYNYITGQVKPFIFKHPNLTHRGIVTNIRAEDKKVGALVTLEVFGEFKASHLHMAEHLGKVLSIAFKNDKYYQNIHGTEFENSILRLAEGKKVTYNTVQNQLKHLGWEINDEYCVLLIQLSESDILNATEKYISVLFENTLNESQSILFDSNILSIINKTRLKMADIEFKKLISGFLESNNLKGGLSLSFSNFTELGQYFSQAKACLEIGSRLDSKRNLYCYEDHAVHHLFQTCAANMDIKKTCHPSVVALLEHDRIHGTDYFNTLHVFLSKDRNLVASSKALFIHRNTLVMRMNKIKEMLNADLDDDRTRLYMLLSCKLLDYVNTNKHELLYSLPEKAGSHRAKG